MDTERGKTVVVTRVAADPASMSKETSCEALVDDVEQQANSALIPTPESGPTVEDAVMVAASWARLRRRARATATYPEGFAHGDMPGE